MPHRGLQYSGPVSQKEKGKENIINNNVGMQQILKGPTSTKSISIKRKYEWKMLSGNTSNSPCFTENIAFFL